MSRWLYRAALAAGLAALAGGCRDAESRANEAARQGPPDPPAPVVATALARMQVLPLRVPIVGTLMAAEEVVVSTKTAGVLQRTFVDIGDAAAPGNPLAQVDPYDYQAEVAQARAALAEALARLGVDQVPGDDFDLTRVSTVARATAQLENARFTHDRLAALTGAVVSSQEYSDAAADLRIAEAEQRSALDEAASLLATARARQAQLNLAEQALIDTRTVAPPMPTTLADGAADHWVVAARLVTEGQYLNTADPLYRLIIDDPLKLRASVPERYAPDVRVGQNVELADLAGAVTRSGAITRVSPAVDPLTRTFEIEALIRQEDTALKPGAFATGAIVAPGGAEVLTVPVAALATEGGMSRVFVVADGAVRRRDVRIGREADGFIEILSGLAPGAEVVVEGLAALRDGMKVQVRTATEAQAG